MSFLVLNIGLSVTESLPAGVRVVAGLFQSFAIRASGFAIVSLPSLAPAFQYALILTTLMIQWLTLRARFLCVIMMYIAVYPVSPKEALERRHLY